MNTNHWRDRGQRPVPVRRQFWIFCGVAAIALIAISVAAVTASRSLARNQALRDAERTTTRLAELVIAPLLPGALEGDVELRGQLDEAVKNRLADGYLTDITVWDSTGRVRYDSDPRQIGRRLALPDEAEAAISRGVASADFTDRPEATVAPPKPGGPGFVEIYVPLQVVNRPSLAFEAYYDYGRVNTLANQMLTELIPVVLLPLLLLQLIHIPMAASLASRVRRQEADRYKLLELTLSASERERVRLAADLHDGPIQDLAGFRYAFAVWTASIPEGQSPIALKLQAVIHRSIESLRRLMIDLYPPDLDASQLPRTIFDLALPLREQGTKVTITLSSLPELDTDTVTTLYRIVKESLNNVVEHAAATSVSINLGPRGTDRGAAVYVRIADNGIGLDEAKLDRRAEGHLGLRLLKDRVNNLGGSLRLTTGPQGGAVITAVLPNRNRSSAEDSATAMRTRGQVDGHYSTETVETGSV